MNAYTIQQGFETKVDGTDGEYWMIIAPDGQAVATETHKGKAELAARVWNNQFAVQNERIAELEKRNGDLEMTLALVQTLVITLRGGVKEAQKRLERSVVLQEKALLTAMIAEKTFLAKQLEETLSEMKTEPMQAPQAAPVQAAVTLSKEDIERWAHYNPDYFQLLPEHDTPANRAAIAARRAELGLA